MGNLDMKLKYSGVDRVNLWKTVFKKFERIWFA